MRDPHFLPLEACTSWRSKVNLEALFFLRKKQRLPGMVAGLRSNGRRTPA
jgi:hypothetical protein